MTGWLASSGQVDVQGRGNQAKFSLAAAAPRRPYLQTSSPAAPILADQQARPADVRRGVRQTHPRRSEAAVAKRFVLLASHQGKPGSIPGRVTPEISQVVISPDDAAVRWSFSGISRFPPPPLHSGAAPFSLHFTFSSVLMTSLLRDAQLFQLNSTCTFFGKTSFVTPARRKQVVELAWLFSWPSSVLIASLDVSISLDAAVGRREFMFQTDGRSPSAHSRVLTSNLYSRPLLLLPSHGRMVARTSGPETEFRPSKASESGCRRRPLRSNGQSRADDTRSTDQPFSSSNARLSQPGTNNFMLQILITFLSSFRRARFQHQLANEAYLPCDPAILFVIRGDAYVMNLVAVWYEVCIFSLQPATLGNTAGTPFFRLARLEARVLPVVVLLTLRRPLCCSTRCCFEGPLDVRHRIGVVTITAPLVQGYKNVPAVSSGIVTIAGPMPCRKMSSQSLCLESPTSEDPLSDRQEASSRLLSHRSSRPGSTEATDTPDQHHCRAHLGLNDTTRPAMLKALLKTIKTWLDVTLIAGKVAECVPPPKSYHLRISGNVNTTAPGQSKEQRGYSTHSKNVEALELARANRILTLQLPAHTTHRLQPLDRSFFKPLETYYTQSYQVTQLVAEAYSRAATIQNAINGYRGCGIWPVDHNIFNDSDFLAAANLEENECHSDENETDTPSCRPTENISDPTRSEIISPNDRPTHQEMISKLNVSIEAIYLIPTCPKHVSTPARWGAQRVVLLISSPYKRDLMAAKDRRRKTTSKRGPPRGDEDMSINSVIASTRKALNWRAVLPTIHTSQEGCELFCPNRDSSTTGILSTAPRFAAPAGTDQGPGFPRIRPREQTPSGPHTAYRLVRQVTQRSNGPAHEPEGPPAPSLSVLLYFVLFIFSPRPPFCSNLSIVQDIEVPILDTQAFVSRRTREWSSAPTGAPPPPFLIFHTEPCTDINQHIITNRIFPSFRFSSPQFLPLFFHPQIVKVQFVEASVSETASVLCVSRETVLMLIMAYTDRGNASSPNNNSGRKPIVSDRDRQTLKNICHKGHMAVGTAGFLGRPSRPTSHGERRLPPLSIALKSASYNATWPDSLAGIEDSCLPGFGNTRPTRRRIKVSSYRSDQCTKTPENVGPANIWISLDNDNKIQADSASNAQREPITTHYINPHMEGRGQLLDEVWRRLASGRRGQSVTPVEFLL
ncbi:hypothetical protein PR048_006780 [Dryococelus australis]|uniref:Uncharacterized protein n=1 Tax=Dryococelus australis TaxID=614101 RepID=A0ABQ9IBX1_9NEOP|nr:hypothetical protein PR048_006780 [Dryococelus australis]